MDQTHGALVQLRAYLAQRDLPANTRLPAERELCEILGVSRAELRKALAALETNGELWRHVGKGTFIGQKPPDESFSVAGIASRSNPAEVMRARLVLEPLLASEAARHATGLHISEMRLCLRLSHDAASWRQYESIDNRLHRTIAEASGNTVLEALFDQLNAIRRTIVWGRERQNNSSPPVAHHSFAEHDALVDAIEDRDHRAARAAMQTHLLSVQNNLQILRDAAE